MKGAIPIRATSIGPEARAALYPGRTGRIGAVFARSFYVTLQDKWVCIGEASIGRGPLNLLLDGPVGAWRNLRLHTPALAEQDILRLGDLVLDLTSAALWRPQPLPAWTPQSLATGLEALSAGLPKILPCEGLATFTRTWTVPENRIARAAEPAITSISAWLAAPDVTAAGPSTAVQGLLGLGPGLTPSGDDFLAGVLAGLRLVGRDATADALWAVIEPCALRFTSELSFAHLRAANRFGLAEALHRLLCDVVVGQRSAIRSELATLAATFHNSPWDTLAGCLIVLRSRTSEAGNAGPTRILSSSHRAGCIHAEAFPALTR